MYPESSGELADMIFLTGTVFGMKNIFSDPIIADAAVSALREGQEEKLITLYAFAIMPANIYAIVKPGVTSLESFIDRFDQYTSEEALEQLRVSNRPHLHQLLSENKNANKDSSIWQGIYPLKIKSQASLQQKLEFIHNTPLDKQWQLVENRADYRYSSARFYDRNVPAIIPLEDARKLLT